MVLVLRQAGRGASLTEGRSWDYSHGRQVVVLVLRQAGLGTSLTAGRRSCSLTADRALY